jgi:hypothetical protein
MICDYRFSAVVGEVTTSNTKFVLDEDAICFEEARDEITDRVVVSFPTGGLVTSQRVVAESVEIAMAGCTGKGCDGCASNA